MKTFGRKVALAVGGYWLFYLLYDDRKGGTPLAGFPCSPWWLDLWWGDEALPPWLNWMMSLMRRRWYGENLTVMCVCPGCQHEIPMWWSTPLCLCCGANEECCHEGDDL